MKLSKSLALALMVLSMLLSGCAASIMQQAAIKPEPAREKAIVTFMRPSYFGGAIQFGIWDREKFVGILEAGSLLQYETEPGEHLFLFRKPRVVPVNGAGARKNHFSNAGAP